MAKKVTNTKTAGARASQQPQQAQKERQEQVIPCQKCSFLSARALFCLYPLSPAFFVPASPEQQVQPTLVHHYIYIYIEYDGVSDFRGAV